MEDITRFPVRYRYTVAKMRLNDGEATDFPRLTNHRTPPTTFTPHRRTSFTLRTQIFSIIHSTPTMAPITCPPDGYLSEAHLIELFNGTYATLYPPIPFTDQSRFPLVPKERSAGRSNFLVSCKQRA